jgi:hypothetical protein
MTLAIWPPLNLWLDVSVRCGSAGWWGLATLRTTAQGNGGVPHPPIDTVIIERIRPSCGPALQTSGVLEFVQQSLRSSNLTFAVVTRAAKSR